MRHSKITINKSYLKTNLSIIKNHAKNKEVFPVIKANAYGHGMLEVAKVYREEGIKILSVAYVEEAIDLRNSGDDGELLVLIPADKKNFKEIIDLDLSTTIDDIDVTRLINDNANKPVNVHLYINTGMNRDGLNPYEAKEFLEACKELENIKVEGILTHYINSGSIEPKSKEQEKIFIDLISDLEQLGYSFKYIHAENSEGIFNFNNPRFTACRPGIALYGSIPNNTFGLKQVLKLSSRIISIKEIHKGDTVGYGLKYISYKDDRIGIIPIGYGDGYPYQLTGKAECEINGRRHRIVGSICMDLSAVSLGNEAVNEGDEVELINESLNINEIADKIDLIPYVVSTNLNTRIPRIME